MTIKISSLVMISTLFLFVRIFSVQANELRDPTAPFYKNSYDVKKKESSLDLQGIFFGETRRAAIVNGVHVEEGDRIAGMTIKHIKPDRIIYLKGSKRMEQVLHESVLRLLP